jgi:ATP-dependent Zn protease
VTNGLLEITERAARPGVIILGAANNISRMDAALMRAGRFGDRIIEIPRPDTAALAGILRHHLAGDLASVDLAPFAQIALGATGADVAAWVRGARRVARNETRPIVPDDLMRQISPKDDRSVEDIRVAAYHEAGHCVAMIVLVGQRVDFVTILAKGGTGGQTSSLAATTDFPTREDFEKTVTMLLSGRAAEEVFIGAPSAASSGGPLSDLARATDLVVGMHTAWGMGRAPIVHAHFREASALLRADATLRRTVEDHIAGMYSRALEFVIDNARAVTLIAERLIAVRHLGWSEIEKTLNAAGVPTVKTTASGSIVPDSPAAGSNPKHQFRRLEP